KNWLECDLINAKGEVVPPGTPISEVKGVRYKNGCSTIREVCEFFPNFDDPARWKELDLREPFDAGRAKPGGAMLRIPEWIRRVSQFSPRQLFARPSPRPFDGWFEIPILLAA